MPGQGGMDGVRTLERESPGSCVCGCEWPEGAGVLVEVMAWRLWATALGADLGLCLWPGGSGCVAPLKGPAQRLVRRGERAGGQGGSASSWKNSMPAWNHVKLESELSRQFLAALVEDHGQIGVVGDRASPACTPTPGASHLFAFGVAGRCVGLGVVLSLEGALEWLEVVLAKGLCAQMLAGPTAAL